MEADLVVPFNDYFPCVPSIVRHDDQAVPSVRVKIPIGVGIAEERLCGEGLRTERRISFNFQERTLTAGVCGRKSQRAVGAGRGRSRDRIPHPRELRHTIRDVWEVYGSCILYVPLFDSVHRRVVCAGIRLVLYC